MNPRPVLVLVSAFATVATGAVAAAALSGALLSGGSRDVAPVALPPFTSSAPADPTADPSDGATDPATPATASAAAVPAARTTLAVGRAGTVTLASGEGALDVVSVDPAPGWAVDEVDQGRTSVEVRLVRGGTEAKLEARLSGGRLVHETRTRSRR